MEDMFKFQAAKLALKQTYNDSHFSICSLDNAYRCLTNRRCPDDINYNQLRALHCVHYSEMPPGMKEEIFKKCIEILKTGLTSPDFETLIDSWVSSKFREVSLPKKSNLLSIFSKEA